MTQASKFVFACAGLLALGWAEDNVPLNHAPFIMAHDAGSVGASRWFYDKRHFVLLQGPVQTTKGLGAWALTQRDPSELTSDFAYASNITLCHSHSHESHMKGDLAIQLHGQVLNSARKTFRSAPCALLSSTHKWSRRGPIGT